MSDKDGGPAFPHDGQANYTGGMTLRDWFAGQALAGLLAQSRGFDSRADYAVASYKYADAMLAERGKRHE